MPRRLTIRMTDEQGEQFATYLSENNMSESDAGRIAIDRLLASKPKKSERKAAKLPRGNPKLRADNDGKDK